MTGNIKMFTRTATSTGAGSTTVNIRPGTQNKWTVFAMTIEHNDDAGRLNRIWITDGTTDMIWLDNNTLDPAEVYAVTGEASAPTLPITLTNSVYMQLIVAALADTKIATVKLHVLVEPNY